MFDRIREVGAWTFNTPVEPEEFEQLDDQLSKAIDGDAGGVYAPSDTLSIANLHCPTWPEDPNAVVPKTYLDGVVGVINSDITALENAVDDIEDDIANLASVDLALDGRLDFIEGSRGAFVSTSTAIASNLSNISVVSALRVTAVRMYDCWVGSVYAIVTNSGAGIKSFRISLAGASGLEALADDNDAHGSGAVAFSDVLQVNGISGQEAIALTWSTTAASGDVTLRATFTYRH